MTTLLQDIRFGIRMLLKNPGISLLAVVALAIGIGANSSIFSMVNSVMFSPLPFPDMDRLMRVYQVHEERGSDNDSISGPNYLDVKQQCRSFEAYALVTVNWFNLSSGSGEPQRLSAYMFSPDMFTTTEFSLRYGRGFLADEDLSGKNHVVLLTNGIWVERFGGDPNILGKTIKLDNEPYTVIGILPPDLGFLEGEAKLWVPLPRERAQQNRGNRGYASMARLKQGVTLQQAQAELDLIAKRLAAEYPDTNQQWGFRVEPMMDRLVRFMSQTFLILHGVVAFVLLISCSIVASLLLARASSRQKEIAIRSALGANRLRIVRQVLTESVLLALMGGCAGLLITLWGIDAIGTLLPPSLAPFITRQGVDFNVIVFTIAMCILTGLLFGMAPALQVSKTNLRDILNEGGRGSGIRSRGHRALRILVIGEIALSLVLLIGAGLLINSFVHLQHVNPGFKSDNLLTCHVYLPDSKYKEPYQKRAFYRDIVQRIETMPGVVEFAAPSVLPMTWGEGSFYQIEGQPPLTDNDRKFAQTRSINPDYFQLMKIPLLKGRYFTSLDESDDSYNIIVNEILAKELEGDPIGQRIQLPEWGSRSYEIVGVVGNVKQFGLKSDYQPEIYATYLHRPVSHISFALKTQGDPHRYAAALRQKIHSLDADLPINMFKTMDELIADSMIMDRFGMILMTIFSVVALVLSSLGIYGIMAYSTSQRTHEIGIRIAIGAQFGDVIRLVVWQGVRLTAIGVVLGLAGAFAVTRILSSWLYGVSATDPLTFINISLLLAAVSIVACFIPARKAANVDPIIALRCE